MKIKTLKIMFLLLIAPYMFGCDSKQPEQPKPSPKQEKPVDLLKAKLGEIKTLRQTLIAKQHDFISKKEYFQIEIEKIKQELIEEQEQERIDNRLANIQECDAYLQELDRRLQILSRAPDKLYSLERSFNAKIVMISLMSETEINDLKNQITKIIKEYSPEAAELVIDKSKINLKSKDEILNGLKAEKEELSKKKVELLNKKQEEEKEKNSQIWEEVCNGVFFRINQLTEISAESARCLSQYDDETLKLDNLTTLSPEAAQHLAGWDGVHLYLNGLKELSPETAKYLAELKSKRVQKCTPGRFWGEDCSFYYNSKHLYLNGLIMLSRDNAKYLSQFKGTISLQNLTDLSEDTVVFLAKRDDNRTKLSNNIKQKIDEIRKRR